jgi:DNA-binding NarL/FixJ family response regulator
MRPPRGCSTDCGPRDTVRTHVRNAMTKLRARSRAHLVANARGRGAVLA